MLFIKSIIYQLAPMDNKKMGRNGNPVVVVVSPLEIVVCTHGGPSKRSIQYVTYCIALISRSIQLSAEFVCFFSGWAHILTRI